MVSNLASVRHTTASMTKPTDQVEIITDLTGLFWTRPYEKRARQRSLEMPKKRFSAEQIVVLLRQIKVLMSQGKAAPVACQEAGISQQSYYLWRKEYGAL